jgi:hypothetical protein
MGVALLCSNRSGIDPLFPLTPLSVYGAETSVTQQPLTRSLDMHQHLDHEGVRIQRAISDACDRASSKFGSAVFIPHGEYGLAGPLDLLGECR